MNNQTKIIYENYIGKIEFSYDSPFWISTPSGMTSDEIEISETSGAMQVGTTITGQSVLPKKFTLDGVIFEPLVVNRKNLINIMAPQIPSTLTVIENNESWFLDVVPQKTPEIEDGIVAQNFQVTLYAAYPFWKTTEQYTSQLVGIVPLFQFPFDTSGSWSISEFTDNYFTEVENEGNSPIEFSITFSARSDVSNPELYHMGSDKFIKLNKSMIAGEVIVVSTKYGEKGVLCYDTNGNVSNGFKYLTIDSDLSMQLLPGNNLLRFDAGNRQGLSITVNAPKGVKSGV